MIYTYKTKLLLNKIILYLCLFYIIFLLYCHHQKIIYINEKALIAEIADTLEKRNHGLMLRKKLDKNNGMLFIFEKSERVSFWMKNTFIPLSIAFIDTKGMITEIQDMVPLDQENLHQSLYPVKYALEVNQGWFKENNIKVGDRIIGIK